MTVQRPSGKQLDIQSIATTLTTDASALSILDAEYARSDDSLKLTGGTLTGNLSLQNLYVDGSIGIQTDKIRARNNDAIYTVSPFSYAGSVVNEFNADLSAVTSGTVMHKGYIDDNFVSKTGDSTITDTNDLYFNLDSGANPIIMLKTGGANAGRIYANHTSLNFTHYDDNSGSNSFKIYHDYTITDKEIRQNAAQSAQGSSLTRRDWVENNFLDITGGTLNTSGTGGTSLTIHGNGANANLFLQNDSGTTGVIYNPSNALTLLKYHDTGGTNTQFQLNNESATLNKSLSTAGLLSSGTVKNNGWTVLNDAFSSDNAYIDTRKPLRYSGVTVSDDDDLVNKKYVEDNFITSTGNQTFSNDVTINGNLSVAGTTTAVNSTDLEITDNQILVNAGETGAGVALGTAGVEVDRGTLTNQLMVFDESDDKWKMGTSTALVEIASTSQVNAKENAFSKNSAFNKNFGTTSGTVTQGNDSRLSNARTPTAHTHTIANVTNLQDSLDDKEDAFSKNTAFNKNFGTGSGTVCQGNDSRLSNARTPTAHTHTIANVTNLQNSLNAKENSFSKNDAFNKDFGTSADTVCEGNDSRLSNSRTPTAHTHTIANITNLQVTLNGKAASSHTHTIANITDLQTTLNGKASSSHTHTISNISNLQTTLNGKEPAFGKNDAFNKDFGTTDGTVCEGDDYRLSNSRTPTAHTHTIANISSLQSTLNGKAAASHTHTIANITSLQSTLNGKEPTFSKNTAFNKNFGTGSGTVCQGNDSRLSNSRTPTAHNHNASNITAGSMSNARITQGNVTQHQAALQITKSQITDFGDYATNALVNTKIAQSGGWMYGDLTMRMKVSGSADTQNGIVFSEHAGNGTAAFAEMVGERVGSAHQVVIGARTGSARTSHIGVTTDRININSQVDIHTNLDGKLAFVQSIANGTISKMSMRAPVSTGNAEIEMISGTGNAARIAVSSNQTQSYTMVLPTNQPDVGDTLQVSSKSGQFVFMIWA